MPLPELLDRLLRAPGPSGHEDAVAEVLRDALGGVAEVERDTLGTTFARLRGSRGGPTLALFAHLDEIGLAVAHVGDDGLLSVHNLGVWSWWLAPGRHVEVHTRGGAVPGAAHRAGHEWKEAPDEWSKIHVDVGARSAEEARALGIRPGDPVVVVAPPYELANGRVASKALDNRASVYAAAEALLRLAEAPPTGDVVLVGSVHEELGHAGARAAAYAARPDVAIALDVTYATDVPGEDAREAGDHRLGGGPALFRGPAINPHVHDRLVAAAEAEGIAHTIETGMKTWTDADDTFQAGAGVATGLVSIPVRGMHTPAEIVQLSDVEDTVRLLVAFARALEVGADFRR